jgi:DMSO/TMAO reductase YedYZ molybdopterin-dependent catalytic subunit
MLAIAESLNAAVRKGTSTRLSMAQEFPESELSPSFRSNGTSRPSSAEYERLAANAFADYRLDVGGLVAKPLSLSLDDIRALPSRTQITRHDCVEGWSAIGKWKGARLSALLKEAQPSASAKYVVFRCADSLEEGGDPYYESIDMDDAYHEQTLLAYELNDAVLPIENGAPLRLRVERQLGYKMAKYVMRIELVDKLDGIGGGQGGYWEDQGYQWYAGI